jgi:hypothetical protein
VPKRRRRFDARNEMTCPVQGLTGTSKALACGSKSPRWIGLAASRPEQCRNPERSGSLLLSWSRGGGDVFHLSRSFVPLAGVSPGLDIETIGRALILLTQKGSLTLTSLTHKDFGKGSTAISTGRRFRIFFPLTSSTRSHVIAIPLYLSLRQLSSYQSMSWLNDIHARFSPRSYRVCHLRASHALGRTRHLPRSPEASPVDRWAGKSVKERLDLMTCAERSGLVIRSFRRSLGRSIPRISSHSANEVFADRIEISRSTRTA